jgi:hypothetical protein
MGSEIFRTTEHGFSSNVDGMEQSIVSSEFRPLPVYGVEPKLCRMARPRGFEPLTFASGGQRSIQLSYGRMEFGILHALSPRQSGFR